MALESYATAQDYQALYGSGRLTGSELDDALWMASRDADRLTLGRIEAAGGMAGLNDRCAELVKQAVCRQADWLAGDGAVWQRGLKRYDIGGIQMEFASAGTAAAAGVCDAMAQLLALTGLCCREVGP